MPSIVQYLDMQSRKLVSTFDVPFSSLNHTAKNSVQVCQVCLCLVARCKAEIQHGR